MIEPTVRWDIEVRRPGKEWGWIETRDDPEEAKQLVLDTRAFSKQHQIQEECRAVRHECSHTVEPW